MSAFAHILLQPGEPLEGLPTTLYAGLSLLYYWVLDETPTLLTFHTTCVTASLPFPLPRTSAFTPQALFVRHPQHSLHTIRSRHYAQVRDSRELYYLGVDGEDCWLSKDGV